MSPELKSAWTLELRSAHDAQARGDARAAWRHLERAHILSQPFALPHVEVHARMLWFALRRRDGRELVGQLIRTALAAPASWLGRAPLGNTGGSDVGLLTPMPLPNDLRQLLSRETD